MLTHNQTAIDSLLSDLKMHLIGHGVRLFELNRIITLDSDYTINQDIQVVFDYLGHYSENFANIYMGKIKPKGRVLVILPYNEPFILSIIPILNALIAGNEVFIKPSSRTFEFVSLVWDKNFIQKHDLPLSLINIAPHEIEEFIVTLKVSAVYFFGSHAVAKDIARVCGKYYVEFYPETETADCKIYKGSTANVEYDAALTLRESFTHAGQSCHRVQGVYVHEDAYLALAGTPYTEQVVCGVVQTRKEVYGRIQTAG